MELNFLDTATGECASGACGDASSVAVLCSVAADLFSYDAADVVLEYNGTVLSPDEDVCNTALESDVTVDVRHSSASQIARIKASKGLLTPDDFPRWVFSDPAFAAAAVELNGTFLKHMSDELRDDFALCADAVRAIPASVAHVSDRLKDSAAFMCQVPSAKAHCSERLKQDVDFAKARYLGWCKYEVNTMSDNKEFMSFAAPHTRMLGTNILGTTLRQDEAFLRSICDKAGWILSEAPLALKQDLSFVSACSKTCNRAFHCASITPTEEDLDYVLLALSRQYVYNDVVVDVLCNKEHPRWSEVLTTLSRHVPVTSFKEVYKRVARKGVTLVTTKEQALQVVKQNGSLLSVLQGKFYSDRDVVLCAVRTGGALREASTALRNDREVVLAAVRHNGKSLFHASHWLRDDKDIVIAAIKSRPKALRHASPRLRKDISVALLFLQYNGKCKDLPYGFLHDTYFHSQAAVFRSWLLRGPHSVAKVYINDRELALKASRTTPFSLALLKHYGDDEEIVVNLVAHSADNFNHVSSRLLASPRVVTAAAWHRDALRSSPLRKDYAFVKSIVSQKGLGHNLTSADITIDSEILKLALDNGLDPLKMWPPGRPAVIHSDAHLLLGIARNPGVLYCKREGYSKVFMLEAVRCNWRALEVAPQVMKEDKDVVLAAVAQNKEALQWASPALQKEMELEGL